MHKIIGPLFFHFTEKLIQIVLISNQAIVQLNWVLHCDSLWPRPVMYMLGPRYHDMLS